MVEVRLVRQVSCEHGYYSVCTFFPCPGGETTDFEPDIEAATAKLWSRDMVRDRGGLPESRRERLLCARAVVDAALGKEVE